jgi:hypothetical protein
VAIARLDWLEMPVLRELDCLPVGFQPAHGHSEAYLNLEARHLGSRLGNCQRCPHHGHDLSSVKPNASGVKVCPLHGLQFGPNGYLRPRINARLNEMFKAM